MSVPFWLSNQNKTKVHTDILIIGGGISGLGVAHFLSKNKSLKVTIVEKHSIGYGASGRNAGFISTGSITLFNNLMNKYGLEQALKMKSFYKSNHDLLKQEFKIDSKKSSSVDYSISGSVSIAFSVKEDHLFSTSDHLNSNGFKSQKLSSSNVLNTIGVSQSIGGFLDPEDAQVHSGKLLSLIKGSLSSTNILEHQEVYKVSENVVLTNDYEIHFKKIVFALNAYSSLLLPELSDYIKPVRGQMLVLDKGPVFMKHNAYATKMLCYFRQLPEGEFLIGGMRTLDEKNEVGFSDHGVNDLIQNSFKSFITDHIPSLANREVLNQWSGIMGFSYDENPLVGNLDTNRFILGGYTGHGMGKAFACAKSLSDLILSGMDVPSFLDVNRIKKS